MLMMQFLPFLDEAAQALLEEFETAVYGSVARKNLGSSAVRIGAMRREIVLAPSSPLDSVGGEVLFLRGPAGASPLPM